MAKKNIVKAIAAYLISALLVVFYIFILIKAKDPDVSLEYRLYYIDKVLSESARSGELFYELGETEYLSTNTDLPYLGKRRSRIGWAVIEGTTCWTDGNEAELFYSIPNNTNKDLELLINTVGFMPNVRVQTYANDTYIGTMQEKEGFGYEFQVKKECLTKDLLKIKFHIENPAKPSEISDSKDNRLLGFRISDVQIRECK